MQDFLGSKYPEYFSHDVPTDSDTQTALTEEFIHYSLIGYDRSLCLEAYRSNYKFHVHTLMGHFKYRNAGVVKSLT